MWMQKKMTVAAAAAAVPLFRSSPVQHPRGSGRILRVGRMTIRFRVGCSCSNEDTVGHGVGGRTRRSSWEHLKNLLVSLHLQQLRR